MAQREFERLGLGGKVAVHLNQSSQFVVLVPIPKGNDRAASSRPASVLAPGSALGACRHGALSWRGDQWAWTHLVADPHLQGRRVRPLAPYAGSGCPQDR